MKLKLRLGVMLVIVRDGAVLIARKKGRNDWLLPGGGREKGETVLQTARRELQEEVGLDVPFERMYVSFVVREYHWNTYIKRQSGYDGQRQHVVLIHLLAHELPRADGVELEEIRFVKKAELLKAVTYKDLRETLKQVMDLGEL